MELKNQACLTDSSVFYGEVERRARELRRKYSYYQEVVAYHILVGSTIDSRMRRLDFPTPDSVEIFLMEFNRNHACSPVY